MSPRRRTTRRARTRQGFTLLEVMIALIVMTAAVLAVAGLQTTTSRANMAARNRTAAMEFLQSWVERAKMDAMAWQPGMAAPSLFAQDLDTGWFTPSAAQLGTLGQVSADFWGEDTATAANMRYCVNLRGTTLQPGSAIRADVRVWWYREGGDSPITANTTINLPDGGTVNVQGAIESRRDLVAGCGTPQTAPVNDPRVYSAIASTILTAVGP